MHGETIADVIDRAERAANGRSSSSHDAPFQRPEIVEHEDGTVEFGDDPDYDPKEWELGEYGFPDDGHDYSQYFKPRRS